MDGFGGIIVLFVIIGIISSIASAAKKKSGGNQNQPPRRTLSDIQRAFMMMSGQDDDEQQAPPAPPRQTYAPPPPQQQGYVPPRQQAFTPPPPRPAYTPPQAYSEGASSYGATLSREGTSSGFASSGSLGNTALEDELLNKYTAATESIKEAEESINELEILQEDLSQEVETVKHHAKPALKLFADKNDYVRAVIYSEILGSGPLARRSAK